MSRTQQIVNWGARIVIFVVFAVTLYATQYQKARDFGFYVIGSTHAIIQATNEGSPFYLALQNPETGERELVPWSEHPLEYGLHLLVTAHALFRDLIGDDAYQVTPESYYRALFALFLFTAFVFLLPSVPFPICAAGILALGLSFSFGAITFLENARGWGTAYVVLLVGMVLVTSYLPRRAISQVIFAVLLTSLTAFSQLIREEGLIIIYATSLFMLVLVWLMMLIAYRTLADRQIWREILLPTARRMTTAAVTLVLLTFLVTPILRGVYALAWDQSYTETLVTLHGRGLPLYLGLGFVSNPYNIVWFDPMALYHESLYKDVMGLESAENLARGQDFLVDMYREVAGETPWLVLENMRAKMSFMHHYLWTKETPFPSTFTQTTQTQELMILYRLSPLLLLALAVFVARTRHPLAFILLSACAGLGVSASVGALTAFPSYVNGVQGTLIVVVTLLPASFVLLSRDSAWEQIPRLERKRIIIKMLLMGVILILVMVILLAGWILLRRSAYQGELERIAEADPLAEIQNREFRYGHYFNDLSQAEQERIIDKLRNTDSNLIALPSAAETDPGVFRPVLVVVSEHQLHVIVWLGDDWAGPVDYLNQSRVHSLVQVCADCDEVSREFGYTPDKIVYTYLNDTDWRGAYRFLSFSVDAQAFLEADHLLVVAQRLRFRGGAATTYNFGVDEIGYQSLFFNP